MAKRLVIEWTRATLRVALAETRGKAVRLVSLRHQPLSAASGGPAEILRAMLTSMNAAADEVIVVVPREQVITRTVKFPSTQRDELAQMVELYAKAELPYSREQTVLDFHVISQREGFSTTAVVACQREVIERTLSTLRDAGISAGLLTVSSWGVLGWYQLVKPPGEPNLVIHVDDARTDLVLISEGRILSNRSVGQGTQDWAGPSETVELLALEIERSRGAIRKELPGIEVRSVVLTGVGDLSAWSEGLSRRVDLPVAVVEAARAFKEGMTTGAATISPVVIGGIACSDPRTLLNLNPPALRAHVHHRQQLRELITAGLLLIGVLGVGVGLLGIQILREQRRASQVDQALASLEPTAKQIQEKIRLSKFVFATLDHRRRLAVVLSGVFRTTPQTVALEGVTFERAKREMTVRGNASSTQDVLDYVKALEQLHGVGGVRLKYSTRRSTPSGERTDFELVLQEEKA